jgi:hypothetical protein
LQVSGVELLTVNGDLFGACSKQQARAGNGRGCGSGAGQQHRAVAQNTFLAEIFLAHMLLFSLPRIISFLRVVALD